MSGRPVRRGLFWQVYPTLLVSLLAFAVLAAVAGHLMMGAGMAARIPFRPQSGLHPGPRAHFVILFLLLATAVGVAAYPVMARATRRLESLRRGVAAWGEGEMIWRADARGSDEIAALAASFNIAADRIDGLLAAHKNLLANASHELRSPLARLAVAAEMVTSDGDGRLAAAVRREIAEIDGLVDENLLASRLDSAADFGALESVDLLALAAEEAARAGVELLAAGADAEGMQVVGWPRLLRRMIRNLIDNALRHGAPPVVVQVAAGAAAGPPTVRIMVRDHGPGVEAALREKVFEPFFRPLGWSEAAGGWGLGLALVRQIARRHGGEARILDDETGALFVAELPAGRGYQDFTTAAASKSASRSL